MGFCSFPFVIMMKSLKGHPCAMPLFHVVVRGNCCVDLEFCMEEYIVEVIGLVCWYKRSGYWWRFTFGKNYVDAGVAMVQWLVVEGGGGQLLMGFSEFGCGY